MNHDFICKSNVVQFPVFIQVSNLYISELNRKFQTMNCAAIKLLTLRKDMYIKIPIDRTHYLAKYIALG